MKLTLSFATVLCLTAALAGQKVPDLRLDGDGANGISTFPQLTVDNTLHAAWLERRVNTEVVFYSRSTDNGRTWLRSPLRLDTKPLPTTWAADEVRIAAVGDRVYAVWSDRDDEVRFNRSVDGGRTWLAADVRVDHGISDHPRIAAVGDAVHVVWSDSRNGVWDVYYNRSLDRGATWLPADIRLDSSSGASLSVEIVAAGPTVVVVWAESQTGRWSIRANRSLDAGSTTRATAPPTSTATDPSTTAPRGSPSTCA